MLALPQMQRLWALYTANYFLDEEAEQVIGAIIDGPAPGIIEHDPSQSFVGVVSFARLGDRKDRRHADGRAFVVRPVIGESARPLIGQRFASVEAALAWLDAHKQHLLDEGWIEVELDPEHDPD